jgi:RimJ/RimL family protein N-acetyltransferase
VNLRRQLVKKIQKVGWVYLSDIFFVTPEDRLAAVHPKINCQFVAITPDNCIRVRDFREEELVAEFREKVQRGEKGFFAVCEGKMAGSIWATVNESAVPTVVRGFMRLMPREALIHDIVTGTKFRGLGIGPFMVTQISPILLQQCGVSRIIIDVNVRNTPSLRMMNKAGLQAQQKALAISAFQKLVFHKTLGSHA